MEKSDETNQFVTKMCGQLPFYAPPIMEAHGFTLITCTICPAQLVTLNEGCFLYKLFVMLHLPRLKSHAPVFSG